MIKKFDTYLGLCTEVYDLSKPIPPEDAYNFYRYYVTQANGKTLEPMCGTGRFMLPLMEEGFKISGFDASEYMLDKLKNKANLKNLDLNVWQGFAENFNSTERYNLIFIPSGSFGLIIDQTAVRLTLKNFYNHLNNGGILIFEAETLRSIPTLEVWKGSKWQRDDHTTILLSTFATLEKNICAYTCKYDLVENNQIIHTEIEELKIRIYEAEELLLLLKETGFNKIKPIKAFDRSKFPDPKDEVVIYECRK